MRSSDLTVFECFLMASWCLLLISAGGSWQLHVCATLCNELQHRETKKQAIWQYLTWFVEGIVKFYWWMLWEILGISFSYVQLDWYGLILSFDLLIVELWCYKTVSTLVSDFLVQFSWWLTIIKILLRLTEHDRDWQSQSHSGYGCPWMSMRFYEARLGRFGLVQCHIWYHMICWGMLRHIEALFDNNLHDIPPWQVAYGRMDEVGLELGTKMTSWLFDDVWHLIVCLNVLHIVALNTWCQSCEYNWIYVNNCEYMWISLNFELTPVKHECVSSELGLKNAQKFNRSVIVWRSCRFLTHISWQRTLPTSRSSCAVWMIKSWMGPLRGARRSSTNWRGCLCTAHQHHRLSDLVMWISLCILPIFGFVPHLWRWPNWRRPCRRSSTTWRCRCSS